MVKGRILDMENMEQLKILIKESIREVLKEERLSLYETLISYVSKKEMREIEERLCSSSDYDKEGFMDMTDWVEK